MRKPSIVSVSMIYGDNTFEFGMPGYWRLSERFRAFGRLSQTGKKRERGRARDVLVLLLTDHEDVMWTPEGVLFAPALAVRVRGAATDAYIPSGRIGKLDMRDEVDTAYHVFRLAVQDLARKDWRGRLRRCCGPGVRRCGTS